jgi:hypothetical protein
MAPLACVDETYKHFEKAFDSVHGGFGGMDTNIVVDIIERLCSYLKRIKPSFSS